MDKFLEEYYNEKFKQDSRVGIPFIHLYWVGRIVFLSQKIEQRFKRILVIMNKLNGTKISTKGSLGTQIEKPEIKALFTESGLSCLRKISNSRNIVVHELFKNIDMVDSKASNEELETILKKMELIFNDFQKMYGFTIWNLWHHFEGELIREEYRKKYEEIEKKKAK